ncbi:prepilin-type N-terminal cleavage/methylation domain-containing protein [Candidatus Dojkabacteria bacterium]|nr:prepilin-type N-terminal cleavage/methylation domain-containing protein [Candidatus Dojkabacteria bacterium]
MQNQRNRNKGFTLIEILVVIALIMILAAITIIAINPIKHFADARNAQRSSDVTQILNAVTQYTSEDGHSIADFGTITSCTSGSDAIGSGAGNINLATLLVDSYIVAIPEDPSTGSPQDTGYTICLTSGGRIQVAATGENGATIIVKR